MDYTNIITQKLIEKEWTSEQAAREIQKRYKRVFKKKGIIWTADRFNLVKLGYDETRWLRKLFAEFFTISEEDIPRRDKRAMRARDRSGDPMLMSREARETKKKVKG